VVRWTGALLIIGIGLIAPYLHWVYTRWDADGARVFARAVVFSLLFLWFVGRAFAVLLADRVRRVQRPNAGFTGVSVIVPCHNAVAKIERCVDSILQQDLTPLEVILVENNSSDGTFELLIQLERRHPEVQVCWIPPDPGEYAASVALNVAVERARYPIIVRLDDDTVLTPGALQAACASLADPGTVAAACNLRVRNPDATVWTRLQSIEYLLAMELDRRSQVLANSVLVCSGGMQVFRRDVIMRSGGYVSVPREVSEDMDMTLKAHRSGLVTTAPDSIGLTEVPTSLRALIRQRHRWAISGTVALWLHRRGLFNVDYWHDGLIGFVGLPMKAFMTIRDLVPLAFVMDVVFLVHDDLAWFLLLALFRMGLVLLQLLTLAPALRSRQGLGYWYLIPFFSLVYGPILLATRFGGTLAGVLHVRRQREKLRELERPGPWAGPDADLWRETELSPAEASGTA
jgi:cellulose synthase/poly-beta-1,6-N-acetylglucosamine synthase-like glycosyltransferase